MGFKYLILIAIETPESSKGCRKSLNHKGEAFADNR
jgi:hypothetical protein